MSYTTAWARWFGLVLLGTLVQPSGVNAASRQSPHLGRIRFSGELRVCYWPNYHGIGYRDPRTGQILGLDADLARELAAQLKVKVRWVESSFTQFITDVRADACDVAMMGITMTPQREALVSFAQPYLHTDFQAITMRSHPRIHTWADIDQPGVRVGVTAGTVYETILRERLRQAELVVITPPGARQAELEAGRIDAFISDAPFATRMQEVDDGVQVLAPPKPYYLMNYAWAIKPGDADWLATLNRFLSTIQADGRLRQIADRYRLTGMLILPPSPAGRPR